MSDNYRLEDYLGGKRLRLNDFDEYGILLNGNVDGFVYEKCGSVCIFSVSSFAVRKTRFLDLTNEELLELLNGVARESRVKHIDMEKAIQLRELEKRLLEEGKITRGAA